jgi:hypothetical protein
MVAVVAVVVLQTLMAELVVLVVVVLPLDPVAALIQRAFLVGLACGMWVKPLLRAMAAEVAQGVQAVLLNRDVVDLA